MICFAIFLFSPRVFQNDCSRSADVACGKLLSATRRFGHAADLRQDLVFLQDHVLLVVDLDVVAAVFAEQDSVSGLYVERNQFTLLPAPAAYGDHFAFLRLLFLPAAVPKRGLVAE